MRILGIETSCDETSAAVVDDGTEVLSCAIASSSKDFANLGGVIPEEAARRQLEAILPVVDSAMKQAMSESGHIDAIAVTAGPGLLGSLLIGTTTARTLAMLWKKPLIGVHHTLGHLSSTWLETKTIPKFPILTLSVSGGHTDIWYRTNHTKGELVCTTRDDAAGEAFDKGAVQLGLPYPGGPKLSALAQKGDDTAYAFPSPLKKEDTMDFSFSGLKTSLKYLLRDLADEKKKLTQTMKQDIAASYERAIVAHLVDRLEKALDRYPDTKEIHIVGGVSANRVLRDRASLLGAEHAVTIREPIRSLYCTDNAAMIAAAGYFLFEEKPAIAKAAFKTSASVALADVLA